MTDSITRRKALKQLLASSSSILLPSLLSQPTWAKNKKLGVALVGLGYYSRDLLAPALQLTRHCELRGIVTGTPSKIPKWQAKYGISDANVYHYETMEQLANNPDIDIVYIVLPTFLHKQYAVIAANAGKHVWCEKPMAITVSECQAIIDSCQKNHVKLSIGYRMQHEPNTQTIMQYAKEKVYGAIQHVTAKAGYAWQGLTQDNWRMQQKLGGGALYDMGVYPINAARYATGLEPFAVTARYDRDRPRQFQNADEGCTFTLEFNDGIKADCSASVVKAFNALHVECEKGWYELSPMQSYTGVMGRTSDGRRLNKPITNQQATQMDNDALAIIRNTDVIVPGTEGLMDIRVVEGAIKSTQTGHRVLLR